MGRGAQRVLLVQVRSRHNPARLSAREVRPSSGVSPTGRRFSRHNQLLGATDRRPDRSAATVSPQIGPQASPGPPADTADGTPRGRCTSASARANDKEFQPRESAPRGCRPSSRHFRSGGFTPNGQPNPPWVTCGQGGRDTSPHDRRRSTCVTHHGLSTPRICAHSSLPRIPRDYANPPGFLKSQASIRIAMESDTG
jgi:hypothetical protein